MGPVVAALIASLIERFDAVYQREDTYRLDAPMEVVGLHLIAVAGVGKLQFAPIPSTRAALDTARKESRARDYAEHGAHRAAIYDAERLEPDMVIDGPAVIEESARPS